MSSEAERAPTDLESMSEDDRDLLRNFGYAHDLRRALGGLATFAASITLISVVVGLATVYAIGYTFAGPPLAWTILVVLFGMFLVALVFAELAARFPVAGSIYQWPTRLVGVRWGWMTGWIYLVAWIITIPSVALGLQITLSTISTKLQFLSGDSPATLAKNAVFLGIILWILSTVVNLLGVKALRAASIFGLIVEAIGVFLLIVVFLTHIRRGPGVITHTFTSAPVQLGAIGALLLGAFVPLYQLFGMDEATQLAEETRDPRRTGPQSLLRSLVAAGLLAFIVTVLAPMVAKDVHDPGITTGGIEYLFNAETSSWLSKFFLIDVAIAIITAAIAVHSLIARMIFSQARDGQFVFASTFAHVNPRTKVPPAATIVPAIILIAIPLLNVGNAKIFNAIIGVGVFLVYVAYLGVTVAMLKVRLANGWRSEPGYFGLGKWGLAINVGAVVYLMLGALNLMWPRAYFYGPAWYQRYSAFIVTAVVLILGWVHLSISGVNRGNPPVGTSGRLDAADRTRN